MNIELPYGWELVNYNSLSCPVEMKWYMTAQTTQRTHPKSLFPPLIALLISIVQASPSLGSTNWICNPGPGIMGMFRVEISEDTRSGRFSYLPSIFPGARPAETELTEITVFRGDHSSLVFLSSAEIALVVDTSTQGPYHGFLSRLSKFAIPSISPALGSALLDSVWDCRARNETNQPKGAARTGKFVPMETGTVDSI